LELVATHHLLNRLSGHAQKPRRTRVVSARSAERFDQHGALQTVLCPVDGVLSHQPCSQVLEVVYVVGTRARSGHELLLDLRRPEQEWDSRKHGKLSAHGILRVTGNIGITGRAEPSIAVPRTRSHSLAAERRPVFAGLRPLGHRKENCFDAAPGARLSLGSITPPDSRPGTEVAAVARLPQGMPMSEYRERRSERADFEGLMTPHAGVLLAKAILLTRRRADAWDLVQDTFERALTHLPGNLPAERVRRWLFVVMHNLHLDRCRAARRRRYVTLTEDVLTLDPEAERISEPPWSSIGAAEVEACLGRLDPRLREAFVLQAQGMSLSAIAERLDVPLATVGTRVFRARRGLRQLLSRTPCEAG
jgi:RNA polymerase sigma-70 factor (ECF subfamily)